MPVDMHDVGGLEFDVIRLVGGPLVFGQKANGKPIPAVLDNVAIGHQQIAQALRLDQKTRCDAHPLATPHDVHRLDQGNRRLHPVIHIPDPAGARPELVLQCLQASFFSQNHQASRAGQLPQGRVLGLVLLQFRELLVQGLELRNRPLQRFDPVDHDLLVQTVERHRPGRQGLGGLTLGFPEGRFQLRDVVRGREKQNHAHAGGKQDRRDDADGDERPELPLCRPGHGNPVIGDLLPSRRRIDGHDILPLGLAGNINRHSLLPNRLAKCLDHRTRRDRRWRNRLRHRSRRLDRWRRGNWLGHHDRRRCDWLGCYNSRGCHWRWHGGFRRSGRLDRAWRGLVGGTARWLLRRESCLQRCHRIGGVGLGGWHLGCPGQDIRRGHAHRGAALGALRRLSRGLIRHAIRSAAFFATEPEHPDTSPGPDKLTN